MSDCKTVTHEGKVYQIGGVYEFSDDGDYWAIDLLASIECAKAYPFKVVGWEWSLIRETESTIGTITLASIELVDGNAYMFDEEVRCSNKNCIGIYEKHGHRFHLKNYITDASACTNIRLMTVEKK